MLLGPVTSLKTLSKHLRMRGVELEVHVHILDLFMLDSRERLDGLSTSVAILLSVAH